MLGLIVTSCTSRTASHTVELKDYLKVTFEHSIASNELYILLPLDTCSSCLQQTKTFLLEQPANQNLHLVLISKTNREAAQYAEGLDEKFKVMVDTKGSIYTHPDLAKNLPILFHNKDKNSIMMPFNINTNFDEMKQMVLSFYKE